MENWRKLFFFCVLIILTIFLSVQTNANTILSPNLIKKQVKKSPTLIFSLCIDHHNDISVRGNETNTIHLIIITIFSVRSNVTIILSPNLVKKIVKNQRKVGFSLCFDYYNDIFSVRGKRNRVVRKTSVIVRGTTPRKATSEPPMSDIGLTHTYTPLFDKK